MTNPNEKQIRELRTAYNEAIAAHDARRVSACWANDIIVIAGDGARFAGLTEVRARFGEFFRDPDFISFSRNTASVDIAADGRAAAESGDWVGMWNEAAGLRTSKGRYFAVWRKTSGRWQLQTETFVTLG